MKDAAIVGAGPAGISAAIYLHRAGAELVLLEKGVPGGLLRNANMVENYPGFPEGIGGPALADLFVEQLETLGVKVTRACVTKVRKEDDGFRVKAGRQEFRAETVIIGTGTRPKRLGIRGEQRLAGKRLFYTVTEMPLTERCRKDAIIVGGGDAAFDYALNLHGRGCEVTIVSRSEPRCLGLLKTRVDEAGIQVVLGLEARSVEERHGKVVLSCRGTDGISTLTGNLVLAACGREPELGLLDRSLNAGLKLRNGAPETSVLGMYIVGDAARGGHRQTGIAVGDGIRAAMMVDGLITKRKAR